MRVTDAVFEDLRRRFRQLDGGYGDAALRLHLATGIAALDAALPGGGLPAGALVEIAPGDEAGPPWTVALLLARAAAAGGGETAIVDRAREIHPPAVAGLGLDLGRVAFVRPRTEREAAWAFAEALGSRGVAATVAALERLEAADLRRLQLAAEEGGGVGILVRGRARGRGGGAAMRLRVTPRLAGEAGGDGERFAIEIVRCRGGPAGAGALIEVDRATLSLDSASLLPS